MNLTLTRQLYLTDGIFSVLTDESGTPIAETLEHAYLAPLAGVPKPKIPNGTFTCIRGIHHLGPDGTPIETFEVTGVEGHQGLLFHPGNYNKDSAGCILVGAVVNDLPDDPGMVSASRPAFKKFMELQENVQSFQLVVQDIAT